jgi:hypothetical protein
MQISLHFESLSGQFLGFIKATENFSSFELHVGINQVREMFFEYKVVNINHTLKVENIVDTQSDHSKHTLFTYIHVRKKVVQIK